jgi:hypothetical protein
LFVSNLSQGVLLPKKDKPNARALHNTELEKVAAALVRDGNMDAAIE